MADYRQHGGNPYGDMANNSARRAACLSNSDFLSRVEGVKKDFESLSSNISQIASLHQRAITSTDGNPSRTLENAIRQTQILNTKIKDEILYLKADAVRSGNNPTKTSQTRGLQSQFKARLEQYQQEELVYKKRYEEQIARQYRLVNPDADEEEVREAMQADWSNEGVFQTAVSISHPVQIPK
jgi:syntaxin 1B/2/3